MCRLGPLLNQFGSAFVTNGTFGVRFGYFYFLTSSGVGARVGGVRGGGGGGLDLIDNRRWVLMRGGGGLGVRG